MFLTTHLVPQRYDRRNFRLTCKAHMQVSLQKLLHGPLKIYWVVQKEIVCKETHLRRDHRREVVDVCQKKEVSQ